jgi:hypothetical protein
MLFLERADGGGGQGDRGAARPNLDPSFNTRQKFSGKN